MSFHRKANTLDLKIIIGFEIHNDAIALKPNAYLFRQFNIKLDKKHNFRHIDTLQSINEIKLEFYCWNSDHHFNFSLKRLSNSISLDLKVFGKAL